MSVFAVFCEGHGGEVLLSDSSILSIENRPEGVFVQWRCTCGREGTWRTRGEGAICTP
ncbi:MAG: hypothetical protein JOZ04_13905 [Acidimicrobiia bacterium]|nr:hypothetical protein [Acidimicrobiia bacterium]